MTPDPYVTATRMPWLADDAPDALCTQADPESWFPETTTRYDEARTAKRVCRRCPLVTDCLAWALAEHPSGVWGGTTALERRQLRRKAAA